VIEKQNPKVEPENSRDQPCSIQVFMLKKVYDAKYGGKEGKSQN